MFAPIRRKSGGSHSGSFARGSAQRLGGEPLEIRTKLQVVGWVELSHQDPEDFLLGIDEKGGVENSAPGIGAGGRPEAGIVSPSIGHDAEAVAEAAVAAAGERDAEMADLVAGHQVDGRGLEQSS